MSIHKAEKSMLQMLFSKFVKSHEEHSAIDKEFREQLKILNIFFTDRLYYKELLPKIKYELYENNLSVENLLFSMRITEKLLEQYPEDQPLFPIYGRSASKIRQLVKILRILFILINRPAIKKHLGSRQNDFVVSLCKFIIDSELLNFELESLERCFGALYRLIDFISGSAEEDIQLQRATLNYLNGFLRRLNEYKSKNLYTDLQNLIQLTSLAFYDSMGESSFQHCVNQAKERLHKSKLHEINEKYHAKIERAQTSIKECKEKVFVTKKALRRAQQRRSNAEREYMNAKRSYENRSLSGVSLGRAASEYFKTPAISSIELGAYCDAKEKLEKAEVELLELMNKKAKLKGDLRVNVDKAKYRRLIRPKINGYRQSSLFSYEFAHYVSAEESFLVNVFLVDLLKEIVLERFSARFYCDNLATLWKLMVTMFIARMQVRNNASASHISDHFSRSTCDFLAYNLNENILAQIESFKKFSKPNKVDVNLIDDCVTLMQLKS